MITTTQPCNMASPQTRPWPTHTRGVFRSAAPDFNESHHFSNALSMACVVANAALTALEPGGIHGQTMIPALPARRVLTETAETLAIALAGGLTFTYLALPAGLVSGSVLAVATAALLGRPVRMPLLLARFCYVIVGILLGAVVTPDTLRGVTTWPLSIALLMLCSVVLMLATSSYLRVVHRWDPLSALLGASPGAIVQTMRVLLIVIGLPNGLALFGLVVPAVAVARGPADVSVLGQMILLVAVSVGFAVAFLYLRFPGGLMFGALTGSGLLHGTGFIHAVLPWWIGSSSVIALGALVG